MKISLFDEQLNLIHKYPSLDEIKAKPRLIGHRIVHGGTFTQPMLITLELENQLNQLSELAPLHNPPSIEGIELVRKKFPGVPQYAVFDTSFHATLPEKASLYPIPLELSKKYHIKKYGFHGISHAYLSKKYYETHPKNDKIITLHLGSGCSLAAIDGGKSIDTTMGFTPLDGVMMATRSGELDPAIIPYLSEKLHISSQEMISILNRDSGLKGIGGSASMKDLLQSADPLAKLAVEMFVYRLVKAIGSLIAALKGVDALIFSGGIGENSEEVRQNVLSGLPWKIPYLVIATDENLEMAQEITHLTH